MDKRKAFFWLAVAGTAVLANFTMEILADKGPDSLKAFVGYLHRGPGGTA